MAARAAFDFAARERFAAVLRAHALVLAAVPVVMVVPAHVLVMVAVLNLGHIRVGRGRNADPSIRRDVGRIHSRRPGDLRASCAASARPRSRLQVVERPRDLMRVGLTVVRPHRENASARSCKLARKQNHVH